jgi:hypothetical protein
LERLSSGERIAFRDSRGRLVGLGWFAIARNDVEHRRLGKDSFRLLSAANEVDLQVFSNRKCASWNRGLKGSAINFWDKDDSFGTLESRQRARDMRQNAMYMIGDSNGEARWIGGDPVPSYNVGRIGSPDRGLGRRGDRDRRSPRADNRKSDEKSDKMVKHDVYETVVCGG